MLMAGHYGSILDLLKEELVLVGICIVAVNVDA
jgi:hypothetical protein